MKCRYIVLKKIYSDYIIIFIKNNKYVLYGIDNYIGNVVDIYIVLVSMVLIILLLIIQTLELIDIVLISIIVI